MEHEEVILIISNHSLLICYFVISRISNSSNISPWKMQFLEVIRLEGHGFHQDDIVLSRDMYLLQVCIILACVYIHLHVFGASNSFTMAGM